MSGKGVKVKRSVTLAIVEEWSEGDQHQGSAEEAVHGRRRLLCSPRVIAAVVTASAAVIMAIVKMLLS